MLEDIIVLVALSILLLALVWLLVRMVNALRLQRAWLRGWGDLAQQYGMRFNSGYTRCSVTGMYRGRIIHMLGDFPGGHGAAGDHHQLRQQHPVDESQSTAAQPADAGRPDIVRPGVHVIQRLAGIP